MANIDNKYKCIPFWSWNDELDEKELTEQIEWMHDNGVGGFFMHARGGLTTEYLGDKWFSCIEACLKKAQELGMEAYAYDENGWPSGFAGGKLLEDSNNCDQYLVTKQGPFDPEADAAFDVSGDKVVRVSSGEDVLNIYIKTSNSTADICDPTVVRKFINLTHEQYKKHDIYGNLRGFFTDEPQYYRWGVSFTKMLFKYFPEHYKEDVLDRIALLFVEKEGYRDYRYKYWKAMQDLMLNNFSKQIYDWCEKNNYKLTGHYVEEITMGNQIMCCGGVMPFYEYEHIPGVDHLCRYIDDVTANKQLGSVMAQLGKRQGICEMYALAGWDVTPIELKQMAEYYMTNGVTIMCQHLLPYKEHGQRKRDYPAHYSKINPWVEKDFKMFNDTFSKIGELLTKSTEYANVGIFEPIRTAYFHYQRYGERFNIWDLDSKFIDITHKFIRDGVPFHILDEVIMAKHAHVEGDTLVVGNCRYKYIVIPDGTETMDKTTEALFREYANNGGKFLVVGKIPTYLEGHEYVHDYMKNNVTYDEIRNDQPFTATHTENIRITYRIGDDGVPFIYAASVGHTTNFDIEEDIEIKVKGYSSFVCHGKVIPQKMHFNKGQSRILYFSNEKPEEEKKQKILSLDKEFDVVGEPMNYFTMDYLQYSFDGVNYSKDIHNMALQFKLIKQRYQGDLYLKYSFDVKEVPSICNALIENTRTIEVRINGHVVKKQGTVLEKDLWSFNIAPHLIKGHNEIVVKIDFYEKEIVNYALFGENVQESLRNCLVYDTTIEAIYLQGNFGIYGDFTKGQASNIMVAHNFYMDKPKTHIKSLIDEGYPFFRGDIKLRQKINVDDVDQTLVINERFQMIDLFVNKQFVKRMMFDYKVDLSKYLKKGENEIELVLTVSNRNLLGPFHTQAEEDFYCGPHSFERFRTWKEDDTSDFCLPRYTFVKTII